jgi:hypothetical protein
MNTSPALRCHLGGQVVVAPSQFSRLSAAEHSALRLRQLPQRTVPLC